MHDLTSCSDLKYKKYIEGEENIKEFDENHKFSSSTIHEELKTGIITINILHTYLI